MLAERASYSISMMARVLGVSRSGFYRWVKAGSPEDPWGPLKEAIAAIWEESGRRFGFRKVWSKLMDDPRYAEFAGTTRYRVQRCMSGLGIRVCLITSELRIGGGTGNPYQTMTFGGRRVLT